MTEQDTSEVSDEEYWRLVSDMAVAEKEREIVRLAKEMVHSVVLMDHKDDLAAVKRAELGALLVIKKMAFIVGCLDHEDHK